MEEGFRQAPKSNSRGINTIVPFIVALVVVGGVGFVGGMQYQKGSSGSTVSSQQADGQAGGAMGGGMGMGRGAFGEVTAVSSTSITVKNTRSSTDTTLTIGTDTKVTNNGSNAAVSDIKVGDQVMIQTSTSDTKVASQINLNPTMPSGGGPNGQMQSSDGTTQTN